MKCSCGSERIITINARVLDVNVNDRPYYGENDEIAGKMDVWVCNHLIDEIGLDYDTFSPEICLDCRRIINGLNGGEITPIEKQVFTIAEDHNQEIDL